MNSIITKSRPKNARYIRIVEDNQGRTIEAWVMENEREDKPTKTDKNSFSMFQFVSLFGWGFLGMAIGDFIFFGLK